VRYATPSAKMSRSRRARGPVACLLDPSCWGDREGDVRNWQDSSTVGVVGCFFVFLGLLLLAGWIAWQIMESAIPG
jgi:hypothetical protein